MNTTQKIQETLEIEHKAKAGVYGLPNTSQNNSIREKAKQILIAKRPRAKWANPRVLDYLDHSAECRVRGIPPSSVGSWITAQIRRETRKISSRYYSSFWKSLKILELAGLVERTQSRTGSPAYWWKGK